jgi:hypothetical protein
MYAAFIEVNDDGSDVETSWRGLSEKAAPGSQAMGAVRAV